jgi:chemotaxis protein MotB
MRNNSRRQSNPVTAWPGYVDVLSALLMVVIFVLMIFTLAQFMLSEMLFGQKNELTALHNQISELSELLGLEQGKNTQLNSQVKRLSDVVAGLTEDRDVLIRQVEDYTTQLKDDSARIEQQLLTMASLNEDIQALRQVKDMLEQKVASLAAALSDKDHQVMVLRDRSRALSAELAEKTETTVLAQKNIEEQDIRIQALSAVLETQQEAIDREQQLTADARAEVTLLSDQIGKLQAQLQQISTALALVESQGQEKDERLAALGKQLNIALARKVNELQKYRSEFFERLQKILGDNPAVQIQGDRFVLQAGLLFGSGSADLGEDGQGHLASLATTLLKISREIPPEIDWILRIDGHTDRVPIQSADFASNWELSTARAVSVVKYLSREGIPAARMAATGFSKYHPLDPANTPEAYQKNRRIEIKLTSQ